MGHFKGKIGNAHAREFPWEHPIVKRFSVENFRSPVKIGPKMAIIRELRGVNVKFLSSNPEKAHRCAEPRRLTYCAWKSVQASRL